jgi:hypothetical protein
MPASMMNTSYHKEVMSIDKPNSSRDATGPAKETIGTAEEYMNGSLWDIPEISGTGDGSNNMGWTRPLGKASAHIHAGKLYLTGVARGSLPTRLVKRIDQFSLKVLKSHVRRYCV